MFTLYQSSERKREVRRGPVCDVCLRPQIASHFLRAVEHSSGCDAMRWRWRLRPPAQTTDSNSTTTPQADVRCIDVIGKSYSGKKQFRWKTSQVKFDQSGCKRDIVGFFVWQFRGSRLKVAAARSWLSHSKQGWINYSEIRSGFSHVGGVNNMLLDETKTKEEASDHSTALTASWQQVRDDRCVRGVAWHARRGASFMNVIPCHQEALN